MKGMISEGIFEFDSMMAFLRTGPGIKTAEPSKPFFTVLIDHWDVFDVLS